MSSDVARFARELFADEAQARIGRRQAATNGHPSGWPRPEPLGDDLLPVPAFDTELLPAAFCEHVCDVAERMQVPIDLPAIVAIACLAGVVNRRATIQPKRADTAWVVTPNLWALIVLPPGQLKSPALGAFTEHLAHIEARWRVEYERELKDYERWQKEEELRTQVWREKFKEAIRNRQTPPEFQEEERDEPVLRRLIANDPTVEALHKILSQNPAGILLVRDELAGWLATLDKPGREGDRQFFLEAWNGDKPYTLDRIGRGTIHAPAVCLSIVGGIQPSRLRQYLADVVKGGANDDGLFQRLQLLVWPDVPSSWTRVDRPPRAGAAERVAQVYERLAEISTDAAKLYRFADDAQELFYEWWEDLERKVRSGDLHPAMQAHLSKYRSLMPSVALLYHQADTTDPAVREVSLCHARQAAAMCEYLEAHARRIYGCLVSPELHAARELAGKITKGKLAMDFSTRDVYLKGWSGLSTPDEARAALRVLEDSGWVRTVVGEKQEGRPSERWKINPNAVEVRK